MTRAHWESEHRSELVRRYRNQLLAQEGELFQLNSSDVLVPCCHHQWGQVRTDAPWGC